MHTVALCFGITVTRSHQLLNKFNIYPGKKNAGQCWCNYQHSKSISTESINAREGASADDGRKPVFALTGISLVLSLPQTYTYSAPGESLFLLSQCQVKALAGSEIGTNVLTICAFGSKGERNKPQICDLKVIC